MLRRENIHFRKLVGTMVLVGLLCSQITRGQIFPLKTGDNGKYLETARGLPFFLNATTWEADSIHPYRIIKKIKALNAQGYNALAMNLEGIPFPYHPALHSVKRVLRIAKRNKMAVLLYPILPAKATPSGFYTESLKKFKNLIWIYPDTCQMNALRQNPDRLIGRWIETSSNKTENILCLLRDPQQFDPGLKSPQVLIIQPRGKLNPALHKQIREKIYSGIFRGMAGFVIDQQNYLHGDSDTLAGQIHLARQFFELFSWQQFRNDPELIIQNGVDDPIKCLSSQDNQYLKIIYFPKPATIKLRLSSKNEAYKIEWINPETGKSQEATIPSFPLFQLFYPPLSPSNSDWIMVLVASDK